MVFPDKQFLAICRKWQSCQIRQKPIYQEVILFLRSLKSIGQNKKKCRELCINNTAKTKCSRHKIYGVSICSIISARSNSGNSYSPSFFPCALLALNPPKRLSPQVHRFDLSQEFDEFYVFSSTPNLMNIVLRMAKIDLFVHTGFYIKILTGFFFITHF